MANTAITYHEEKEPTKHEKTNGRDSFIHYRANPPSVTDLGSNLIVCGLFLFRVKTTSVSASLLP